MIIKFGGILRRKINFLASSFLFNSAKWHWFYPVKKSILMKATPKITCPLFANVSFTFHRWWSDIVTFFTIDGEKSDNSDIEYYRMKKVTISERHRDIFVQPQHAEDQRANRTHSLYSNVQGRKCRKSSRIPVRTL